MLAKLPCAPGPITMLPDTEARGEVRVVERFVRDLRPHPSFARLCPNHCDGASARQLRPQSGLLDEPLTISHENYIIDGYAQWHIAKSTGRETLRCLEHRLSCSEALLLILQYHSKTSRLNDFTRIHLALELESWFREQAHANLQRGGRLKGSSNMTKAEAIDVRAKLAQIAGVCVGNVTKVKRLQERADPRVLNAVRGGEISIHKAWLWSKLSSEQQGQQLEVLHGQASIKTTVKRLISRHRTADSQLATAVRRISSGLSLLNGRPQLASLIRRIDELLRAVQDIKLDPEGCNEH